MGGWDLKEGRLVYIASVDKAGRLYLPKTIRDVIKAKTFLISSIEDSKILLTPLSEEIEDVTYVDRVGKVYLPKSWRKAKIFIVEVVDNGILLDPLNTDL